MMLRVVMMAVCLDAHEKRGILRGSAEKEAVFVSRMPSTSEPMRTTNASTQNVRGRWRRSAPIGQPTGLVQRERHKYWARNLFLWVRAINLAVFKLRMVQVR